MIIFKSLERLQNDDSSEALQDQPTKNDIKIQDNSCHPKGPIELADRPKDGDDPSHVSEPEEVNLRSPIIDRQLGVTGGAVECVGARYQRTPSFNERKGKTLPASRTAPRCIIPVFSIGRIGNRSTS